MPLDFPLLRGRSIPPFCFRPSDILCSNAEIISDLVANGFPDTKSNSSFNCPFTYSTICRSVFVVRCCARKSACNCGCMLSLICICCKKVK